MSHIPHDRILPQDKVVIHDHGPADKPHKQPVAHEMHVVDARHAMATEPSRWKLNPDPPKAAAKPKVVHPPVQDLEPRNG